jgi:predicted MFS family arabinose efflux permease
VSGDRTPSAVRDATRVGAAGAAVVGVAFGMARFAFGLTLPDVRSGLGLSDALLGLIAGGTFAGFLIGVLLAAPLASMTGSRAPTTVGGLSGVLGAVLVAIAPSAVPLAVGAVLAGSAAGWVWAPYSDIVTDTAAADQRPRLLALISTGTSGGLVLLGLVALAAPSWRFVWAGIGVAAGAAAVINLRWVPKTGPPERQQRDGRSALPRRALIAPLTYTVAFFAATTIYFTYVSDAARAGGLGAAAGPTLFICIGISGLLALLTGRAVSRVGPATAAASCAAFLTVALGLLGLGNSSLVAVLISAVVFGVGYMAGSAVLAIWTAQVAPHRATACFTVALVVGSATSIAVPVLVGTLIGTLGLSALLLATGSVALVVGLALLTPPAQRHRP